MPRMGRPQLHDTDEILDAARRLVLLSGTPAATIDAISLASGAPTGTLYHRFGSREGLLAAMWIRAVRRSQRELLAVLAQPDPVEAAVAGALSIFDFVSAAPDDARLLVAFRRRDLIATSPPRLARELHALNRPVEQAALQLAGKVFGTRSRPSVDRMALALFDLPYGAVRRHLVAGKVPPATLREPLEAAVRAVLWRAPSGAAGARRGRDAKAAR